MRRARERRATVAVGAAFGAAVILAPAAEATTFNVNSLDDDGDADCDDGDCTLRDAIIESNLDDGDDLITFQAGLTGTIELDGPNDDSDTTSDLDIYDKGLAIQGPGAGAITVEGNDLYRVFSIYSLDDSNYEVSISGLTITGGSADEPLDGAGGGVYSVGATAPELTLDGVVITGNHADYSGGGVYVDYGSLTITNSVISDNTTDSEGGGVYVDDTDGDQATEVVMRDSVFSSNSAAGGGAIRINDADGASVIERTTVSGNSAEYEGGGVYLSDMIDASVMIDASTFSGNSTGDNGGGIYVDDVDERVSIQNTTVSGNSADSDAGGVYIEGDEEGEDDITIANSTIVGNTAPLGGGVLRGREGPDGDSPVITSTIVADNPGGDLGENPETETGAFVVGLSLVEDTGSATVSESPAGSNIVGTDPQLGPLANNGGPTQTHLPALSSPALDKGIANGLTADQRGLARTSDLALVPNGPGSDATDIGSVEIQAADVEAQCQATTVRRIGGSAGDDTLTGTDAPEALFGFAGNDTADGAGGNDCVSGDEGNDNAKGGPGKDEVSGGGGKDKVSGGGGKDKVKGQAGKDTLKGGGGADKLAGAGGKDKLSGGGGKDRLKGGPGKDKLSGGGGKDRFNCGGGKDKVTAQAKDKVSASCEKVVETGR